MTTWMRYLQHTPTAVDIPADTFVVHNRVRPQPLGHNGFRAWLQDGDTRLAVCDCGWAPDITHYRIEDDPT